MTLHAHRGFTLIELLVSMSIAAILLVLATPSYVRWVGDAEVQNGAATLADGLRFAHAEAIKRNTNVELVLDPTTGTGGWTVQLPAGAALKTSLFAEGTNKADFVPAPAGSTTVTFNALGQVEAANAAAPTVPFNLVNISSPVGTRPLRVLVGGTRTGIKICDPAWTAIDPLDPKACPPLGG